VGVPQPEPNPYQLEWDHLIEAIRNDKPHNEAKRGAEASLSPRWPHGGPHRADRHPTRKCSMRARVRAGRGQVHDGFTGANPRGAMACIPHLSRGFSRIASSDGVGARKKADRAYIFEEISHFDFLEEWRYNPPARVQSSRSTFFAAHRNRMQTGLETVILCRVGSSTPVSGSIRNTTTLSPSWLATRQNLPVESILKFRGP